MTHVPQRTCVACRGKADRKSLIRFVLMDGDVVRDDRAVLPGRGAWIHDDPNCLALAVRRGAFARAFKCAIPSSAVIKLLSKHLPISQ